MARLSFTDPSAIIILAQTLVVFVIALRVIMMRPATGIALSWLLLVTILPFAGAIIYFMIGERRIGFQRERGIGDVRAEFKSIANVETRKRLTDVDWSRHPLAAQGLDRLGRRVAGSLTVRSSSLKLVPDTLEALRAIARDVDAAKTSVLMEFYIWNEGGAADDVLEAVIRAAGRTAGRPARGILPQLHRTHRLTPSPQNRCRRRRDGVDRQHESCGPKFFQAGRRCG